VPKLDGKIAVITGATSGIGRAVAIEAAREGAAVTIVGRDGGRGARVVGEIAAAGGRARFRATNLDEVGAAEALVADTIEAFGTIDVLVNAAGSFRGGATSEVTHGDWDAAVATNLRSVFFAGQAALEHMAWQGSGSVINVSSVGAFVGFPQASVYCAMKGAIESLTRAWACEYGPRGVTVNSVAPGTVETGMTPSDPEQRRALEGLSLLGRLASPAELAPAVVFLASEQARYIIGTCLVVDGGWRIRVPLSSAGT